MDSTTRPCVPGYIPLVVKTQLGEIMVTTVSRLAQDCEPYLTFGERSTPGVSVWDNGKFTRVLEIYRHRGGYELCTVSTNTGICNSTRTQAYPCMDGNSKRPSEMTKGDILSNSLYQISPEIDDYREENGPLRHIPSHVAGDTDVTFAWVEGLITSYMTTHQWPVKDRYMMRFEIDYVAREHDGIFIYKMVKKCIPQVSWMMTLRPQPGKLFACEIRSRAYLCSFDDSTEGLHMKRVIYPKVICKYYEACHGKYDKKVPASVMNGTWRDRYHFLQGYNHRTTPDTLRVRVTRRQMFEARGALLAQGIYVILRSFFDNVVVARTYLPENDVEVYYMHHSDSKEGIQCRVEGVEDSQRPLGAEEYVYEIVTESGSANVGVGNILITTNKQYE